MLMLPSIRRAAVSAASILHRRLSSSPNYASLTLDPDRDIILGNSRITSLFRAGDAEAARRCFDAMPRKNSVTWNCMLSGYAQARNAAMAQRVFDQIPAASRDVVSWGALLGAYVRSGMLQSARKVFDCIPQKNVICWNTMITGYVRAGRMDAARELFDAMPERSPVTWAIMVSGYLKLGCLDDASELLGRAPELGTAQHNAVLSGYAELGRHEDARDLFDGMPHRDLVSYNTMASCYMRAGLTDEARSLFDAMPDRDVISWTTMIRGYLQNGKAQSAAESFAAMPDKDVVAYNTMLGGYVQHGMLEDALSLFSKMPNPDIVSWNTILQGYVSMDDVTGARSWFDTMPLKDETSWNTLISGFRNEEAQALHLLCDMTREGFRPDQATLTVAVSVCAILAMLVQGKMLHLGAIKLGLDTDTRVASSLITMYSKCGLPQDSLALFDGLRSRDTVAWNAVIASRAHHGRWREALQGFDSMVLSGLRPDHATFLAILSACTHAGLVEDGLRYFESMQKKWKLEPRAEHYACVVDLLGRSGSVRAAYEFINRVPADRQTNTWETLLSSCRVHGGDLELAELAARKVLESHPNNDGLHVVLANIYSAKGMWEDAAGVRRRMRKLGVRKEVACSWVEVDREVCAFGIGHGDIHPVVEELYGVLDSLSRSTEGIT